MKKNEFESIIEKTYILLRDKLKMDDIQALIVISSIILLPSTYFLGIGYTQIFEFKIAFFITIGLDIITIIYSIIMNKKFNNKKVYFIKKLEEVIKKHQTIIIKNLVDLNKLSGDEFEIFTKKYFTLQDFETIKTQKSHDNGADVLAYKNNVKYIISAKRYSYPLSHNAINQLIHAKRIYDGDIAILFTNSTVTHGATSYAESHNVKIINGHEIDHFLRKTKNIIINKNN